MKSIRRYVTILVLLLAVVSVVLGGVFIYQAVTIDSKVRAQMAQEKVTYGLPKEEVEKGNIINTAKEAEKVGNTIREHRQRIAPSYNDLLKGGKYDPTNSTHLTYSQAINMENYLYLGVLALGVTQVVLASGVFMIVVGIALGIIGGLFWQSKGISHTGQATSCC